MKGEIATSSPEPHYFFTIVLRPPEDSKILERLCGPQGEIDKQRELCFTLGRRLLIDKKTE